MSMMCLGVYLITKESMQKDIALLLTMNNYYKKKSELRMLYYARRKIDLPVATLVIRNIYSYVVINAT